MTEERKGANRMSTNEHDHKEFAGDATGAIGNIPTPEIEIDQLPLEPHPPRAHHHEPGKESTDMRDPGWVPEEAGSALAQEREGVPESEIPHNLPASAAKTRSKA
jgi:hypothetical protein